MGFWLIEQHFCIKNILEIMKFVSEIETTHNSTNQKQLFFSAINILKLESNSIFYFFPLIQCKHISINLVFFKKNHFTAMISACYMVGTNVGFGTPLLFKICH